MFFTNPEIITRPEDVVLGAVVCKKDKMSLNNYMTAVESRLLKIIVAGVNRIMGPKVDYKSAVEEVNQCLINYLSFENKPYAKDEEQLLENLKSSYEYQRWESDMYYKFMDLHKGVITPDYPVEVGGENLLLEENNPRESNYLDVLNALSFYSTN